ncbi:MAG: hypothetical protein ACREVR_02670 [Burkholderiales bacterium]
MVAGAMEMDAVYFRAGGWFVIEASGGESGPFTREHAAWDWIAARRVVRQWLRQTAKRPSTARVCAERVSV